MKITFQGHSCFLVESEGVRVLIDPFISGNPSAIAKPEDFSVDAVILTHGHGDHISDAVAVAKRCDCPIIANYEISTYLSAKEGVKIDPMHVGGAIYPEWGRIKLTLAFHGSDIELGHGEFMPGGHPAGVLLTMHGKTFYHAGDTALFGDMKLIAELNRIDAAALPIGDRFTMGPEDALIAASWLNAEAYIPMHFGTFPLIAQNPENWVNQLEEKGLKGYALKAGESITIG